MRFLVLGCNGMIGHTVSLYLAEQGHDVLGVARVKSDIVETAVGDISDTAFIRSLAEDTRYDVIVNCVGILNQFAEENQASAVILNAFLPHYLAELTTGTCTQVIHISTDCVFSGRDGRYTEDAFRDGETFYDRSKALGELEDDRNLTLRNSIIGPDIHPDGIGLMNWFLQQEGSVHGYPNAIWTGLTSLQLAKVIETAAGAGVHGLYHMVPDTSISKYDLLQLINRYVRRDKVEIVPDETVRVDKSLIRTRRDFMRELPGYEQMIRELADWMSLHKRLYPHYNL